MSGLGDVNQPWEMADGPAFLQSLFENASDGIAQFTRDGKIHGANAALCNLLGCAQPDLIGKPFKALFAPEDQGNASRLTDVFQGKYRGTPVEECLLDRKKNSHWVEVSVIDPNGGSRAPHYTAIIHDITEWKLAEANFGCLIRGVPLPIALVGDANQIILANSRFENFFGCGQGGMNEQTIGTFLSEIPRRNRGDSPAERSNGRNTQIKIGLFDVTAHPCDREAVRVEVEFSPLEYQGHHWLLASLTDATAQTGLIEALTRSESKFVKIFRESPMPMTLTRVSDERYLDVNDRYEQLTGYRRDEIVGRTPSEIGLWIYPEQRRELLSDIAGRGHVRDIECSFRMKDGSVRVALGSMALVDIGNENVVLSTAVDITEHKRTLHNLQQVRNQCRTMFDDAPVGLAISDLSGKYLAVNIELANLLGYSRGELIRKNIAAVTHPEDVPGTAEQLRLVQIGQASPGSSETRYVRKDGEVRWCEVRRSLVSDVQSGDPQYIISQVFDITERKKAEQALRETEERFRMIANSAPVFIWMSGTDKLCTYFNQAWLDFTGRRLEQELGNGWSEGVHPDDLGACMEQYSRNFDAHVPFTLNYRLRDKDGEYRWVVYHGIPRFAPDGSFAGYIGSCVDETDRRAAEDALRDINLKLIEAQERERRHIARELHDDINQRLAMLAIEIQQLDASQTVTPSFRARLTKLFNHAVEVSTAVQALSHELHSSSLEHIGIVAAAKSFCREFAHRQKVKVEFNNEDLPVAVPSEVELALYRTLQEGLHNAAKHSGVAKFYVDLHAKNGAIELQIRDSGAGFDPRTATKGKGLGLVSIQERILPLNGSFSIVSAPHQGTELSVRIPLTKAL